MESEYIHSGKLPLKNSHFCLKKLAITPVIRSNFGVILDLYLLSLWDSKMFLGLSFIEYFGRTTLSMWSVGTSLCLIRYCFLLKLMRIEINLFWAFYFIMSVFSLMLIIAILSELCMCSLLNFSHHTLDRIMYIA